VVEIKSFFPLWGSFKTTDGGMSNLLSLTQ